MIDEPAPPAEDVYEAALNTGEDLRPDSNTLQVSADLNSKLVRQETVRLHWGDVERISWYQLERLMEGKFKDKNLTLIIFHTQEASMFVITDDTEKIVAWDKSMIFNCAVMGECVYEDPAVEKVLDLSNAEEMVITDVPPELHFWKYFQSRENKADFITLSIYYSLDEFPTLTTKIDTSPSGFGIFRIPSEISAGHFMEGNGYVVYLPFGAIGDLHLNPYFISKKYPYPLSISWLTGSSTVASYLDLDQQYFACGKVTFSQIKAFLVKTGETQSGDPLYEVSPSQRDFYQCLYKHATSYASWNRSAAYTYDELLQIHPVFFWQNRYGDWSGFGRDDVISSTLGHD